MSGTLTLQEVKNYIDLKELRPSFRGLEVGFHYTQIGLNSLFLSSYVFKFLF